MRPTITVSTVDNHHHSRTVSYHHRAPKPPKNHHHVTFIRFGAPISHAHLLYSVDLPFSFIHFARPTSGTTWFDFNDCDFFEYLWIYYGFFTLRRTEYGADALSFLLSCFKLPMLCRPCFVLNYIKKTLHATYFGYIFRTFSPTTGHSQTPPHNRPLLVSVWPSIYDLDIWFFFLLYRSLTFCFPFLRCASVCFSFFGGREFVSLAVFGCFLLLFRCCCFFPLQNLLTYNHTHHNKRWHKAETWSISKKFLSYQDSVLLHCTRFLFQSKLKKT